MTVSVPGTGRVIAAGVMILAVAQAAACGSTHGPASAASPYESANSSAPGTSAPSTPAPAQTRPTTTACVSGALRPSLTPTGAAAGTAYYALRLTNTSGGTCTLYGYPGVSFVSGVGGQQIGSAATRNPLYPVAEVTVAANATAHATLGVAAAANYPASRCHPAAAHALRVFPPGQTAAVYVKQSFPACSAHVTVLTVTAMRVGLGGQGT
ncbi:MAG TPA: DUF4232 domain-containing protein [Streptosporangiaceae bacterium]|nr:DUF4232 domain-containing protein [Streptosporangiaceae bacterium]